MATVIFQSRWATRRRQLALALAAAIFPWTASADGLSQLQRFVEDRRGAEGSFIQTVQARSGRKPQVSEGRFAFQRPGRFRWDYLKPYPQLLVGDGHKLWSWDKDLNQVTVKPLGDALGATPAAILAGDQPLDRNFILAEGGQRDGLEWVDARPRSAEASFQSMRLGFADGVLQRMELTDNFGQTTELVFTRLTRNAQIDPATFRFVPPPGADVIGQ
ncbi:MAG: outer membrane lipoprotein chaperone LolA [Zoogloeaceae bacterium]|nr:outer membrane lipoprotein chaperone LolA [Zoogloeaceae bacterium]